MKVKNITEFSKFKELTITIISIWYLLINSGKRTKTKRTARKTEIAGVRKERNGTFNAEKSQEIRSRCVIHQ